MNGTKMIRTDFINRVAIAARRKALATTAVYGLSLAVRFTSAAGEEVEIPAQSVPRPHPVLSIMTGNSQLPYQGWAQGSAQPIVFRQGWPPTTAGTSPSASCESP